LGTGKTKRDVSAIISLSSGGSLDEAVNMLGQLGGNAKILAGGQSLIPLLKLRFANPEHLVDLNFIPGTSFIRGRLREHFVSEL
jgi:CO/xanthine dehydrogenase FAD-binding subunit